MLKSLINKLLTKTKLVAKLNLEHLREAGKIVGLTGIDVILDSLGYTGKQIEDAKKYFSSTWNNNRAKVVAIKEIKQYEKEWEDFRKLKEKKQALKDIPVEPKDYSPEEQARVSEQYIKIYMDKIS